VREILSTVAPQADHPLRFALAGELHARPVHALRGPQRVSHLAMLSSESGFDADLATWPNSAGCMGSLRRRRSGTTAPTSDRSCSNGNVMGSSAPTASSVPALHAPVRGHGLSLVPAQWLHSLPGPTSGGGASRAGPGRRESARRGASRAILPRGQLAGSRLSGGAATVWTDFQIHDDGFSRILITGSTLEPMQAGRVVQRLLEIETYRMTALLGLPLSRNSRPKSGRSRRA